MGTEHYIQELLYRYNCVIVPNFGAFLTQMKSAVLHKANNAFYPPTKVISFNEQLATNDGLLVSYMADAEKVPYEEMLERVIGIAKEWKKKLKSGERLELSNIGEFWLNNEGKFQFEPSYQVNYLTSSYGLSSFVSIPITREVLKEEVMELEEKIPFFITPEKKEQRNYRPYLKYAAIFLLAISTGLTGYRFYNENMNTLQFVHEEAQEKICRTGNKGISCGPLLRGDGFGKYRLEI